MVLFADDTNIFYSGNDLKGLNTQINHELTKIQRWLNANKLSINLSKTKYILFGKKGHKDQLDLQINGVVIEKVKEHKVLGVIMDERLDWNAHLNFIKNKIARSLSILYRAQGSLNEKALLTLYNALILPYLSYGAEIWGNNYKSHLWPLLILQKKAMRIIYKRNYREHTNGLFIMSKCLKIHELVEYKTVLMVYKAHVNSLPHNLQNRYQTRESNYELRRTNVFKHKFARTNFRAFSISIVGIKLWNALPQNLTDILTFSHFKRKLKEYLQNRYSKQYKGDLAEKKPDR